MSFSPSARLLQARAWLEGLVDKVGTAKSVGGNSPDARWITIALTWNGLRALGLDEASLSSFPDEFKEGMASRAQVLGLLGGNHPDLWVGELAILRCTRSRFSSRAMRQSGIAAQRNMRVISRNFVMLTFSPHSISPPFLHTTMRMNTSAIAIDSLIPLIEGVDDDNPTPGPETPLKAGEFFLGYVDESGVVPVMPQPEDLSRNGSYIAYLRMEEHVGALGDFLREHGDTPDEQELTAAKFMGRWRSGAPLVLAPDKDDPELGADRQRTNDFNLREDGPLWLCLSSWRTHCARMNPRDTAENMQRRKMIRRGGTYGPALPEGAAEDGVERSIDPLSVVPASFVNSSSR